MAKKQQDITEKLHDFTHNNADLMDKLQRYMKRNPKASVEQLRERGFTELVKISGNRPQILGEYVGVKYSPAKKIEEKAKPYTLRSYNDSKLCNSFNDEVLKKLVNYRNNNAPENQVISIIDFLQMRHFKEGKSIDKIAKEAKVYSGAIRRAFQVYEIEIR